MSTADNNRVIYFVIALGLLAASLPLTWFTIQGAQISFEGAPFGDAAARIPLPDFGGMSLTADAFHGKLGWGVKAPIWLLVAIAGGTAVIGALNELRITSISPLLLLAALGVVGLFFATGLITTVSDEASMGAGLPVAFAGLLLAAGLIGTQLPPRVDEDVPQSPVGGA